MKILRWVFIEKDVRFAASGHEVALKYTMP
jgi:hypothetical protein